MLLSNTDKCPIGLPIGTACLECKYMYDIEIRIFGNFEWVECKYISD